MQGESVKVLLADDSELMCKAIRSLLSEAPSIKFLCQTIRMASSLRPNVILLDLHMPKEEGFQPPTVKSQLLTCSDRIIAISLADDPETKMLAAEYGAVTLLDKSNLGTELIPTLLQR